MPRKREIDWDAVQTERDAGATTTALADKYGVSTPTICAHTHAANGNGRKSAGGGRKLQRSTANRGVNGYGPVLADLEAKREKIDRAITAIRELAG